MPRLSKKQLPDSRKKLEHKLYLARERPDDLYDLSSCDLIQIPDGSFSVIKVFLKTRLLLQDNQLHSLESGGKLSDLQRLLVLNLSGNLFAQLPEEIGQLSSLQSLDLSRNRIQSLPRSIGRLHKLQCLNLEDNCIGVIPTELGNLSELVELFLAGNRLKELPIELNQLQKLRTLTVPLDVIQYPPKDVCELGASAILRHLKNDSETSEDKAATTEDVCDAVHTESQPFASLPAQTDYVQKSNRQEQACQLRRQLLESDEAHARLASQASYSRKLVLGKLAEEQARLNAGLDEMQRKRDRDRAHLVADVLNAEDEATNRLKQLLIANETTRAKETAKDWAIQPLLNKPDPCFTLRKEEILSAMRDMLSLTDKAFQHHTMRQHATKQRTLAEDDLISRSIEKVLEARHQNQSKLLAKIETEEDIQKEAFVRLQAQQDSQARQLRFDIQLVERELCRLTQTEMDRQDRQAEVAQLNLTRRRAELVELLDRLTREQQNRRAQLYKQLVEMERHREHEQRDYWLVQYQRLLEQKPLKLLDQLQVEVKSILEVANASDFLPNFLRHRITYDILRTMTDEDLKQIGVYALGVRQCILAAISDWSSAKLKESRDVEPSAPTEFDAELPSAPPEEVIARLENECCICQNATCAIIFLQCGHVCSCQECAIKLTCCPLCRATISQRIRLQY